MTVDAYLGLLGDISPLINGVLAPSLALFIVPRFLRARTTGEYIGFRDIALLYIFMAWALLNALIIIPDFGVTWEAGLRIMVNTFIPLAGGTVWVKLTDRYGWNKSHQIRQ